MEDEIVEFNGQIKKSKLGQLQTSISNLGGKFVTVQKQLKFEDLGLAEVEKDNFQCLVCSKMDKRGPNAIINFKKFHTDQAELTCQCPRCEIEMPKSKLNQHMDQAHGIKIFNKLIKRSFQPDAPSNIPMKIIRPILDSDPLTLSQEEFNNNDIRTEQFINNDVNQELADEESEEIPIIEVRSGDPLTLSQEEFNNNDAKTEQFINNDVNDINNELADEESEEIPVLEVRTDLNKKQRAARLLRRTM